MRRLVLTRLAVVLSVALLPHCAPGEVEGGPEDTVRTFYRHLNEESYDDAKRLYDDAVLQVLDDPESPEEGFRAWVQQETKNGIVSKLDISKATVEESAATLEYAILYDDGTRERRSVTLTRHDDRWKLGFINKAR